MKINGINKGEEFELPVVSADSDLQMTIDLLKMKVNAEKNMAKDLNVDIREMRRELLKAQTDKTYQVSDDARNYDSILAIQLNLDTCYYVLRRIDPTITKEQVSRLGGKRLAEIVMAIFPTPGKTTDFPMATEATVASP